MKQEIIRKIVNIILAPDWKVIFVDEGDDGTMKPLIEPCAYFAHIKEITMHSGCEYDFTIPLESQEVDGVIELVELHSQLESGLFDNPMTMGNFYKFLAPGEDWTDEDRKASSSRDGLHCLSRCPNPTLEDRRGDRRKGLRRDSEASGAPDRIPRDHGAKKVFAWLDHHQVPSARFLV